MPAAAEISDDRLSSVEADPRHAQYHAARRPARAKGLGIGIELQDASDRTRRMIGLFGRRSIFTLVSALGGNAFRSRVRRFGSCWGRNPSRCRDRYLTCGNAP